jgi:hypothetical protein
VPSSRRGLATAAVAGLWLMLLAAASLHSAGHAPDDVFITYRYADNLAAGLGFTFNPGERVFGITDPGVGLLLAFLAATTGVAIPWLGTLYTAAMLAALAGLLVAAAHRRARLAEGLLGGTLVLACGLLWTTQGAAAPAVLALLLAAERYGDRAPVASGLLAGSAIWFRPDAALGVGILGVLLWLDSRKPPWRYALSALAVVAIGVGLAWTWFGAVVPETLTAKRYHAALNPGSWIGYRSFWGYGLATLAALCGPAARWVVLVGLGGAADLVRGGARGERLLAANGLALLVIYPLLQVPFFPWYAIPTLVAALYGFAHVLGAAARATAGARGWVPRSAAAAALAALGALTLWLFLGFGTWWRTGAGDWRAIVYPEAGNWIRAHSDAQADIAFHEVGMLAYYSQRRVEDLLGLVSPRSLPYAREGDVLGAFLARPPDYFVAHPFADGGAITAITRRSWFRASYAEAVRFDHPELGGWIVVFARRPGAEIPAPSPPRPRVRPPHARAGGALPPRQPG